MFSPFLYDGIVEHDIARQSASRFHREAVLGRPKLIVDRDNDGATGRASHSTPPPWIAGIVLTKGVEANIRGIHFDIDVDC